MEELIICVAPYPSEKQEERFPGKMNIADEIIRSYDAGASVAHLHVRNESGLQTTDIQWFRRDVEKIHAATPMIIEGSTGGMPEHTREERSVSFTVPGIEMGSLNLGSINLWDGVYHNSIDDIYFYARKLKENGLTPFLNSFDLSHFSCLPALEGDGLVSPPHTFGLVFDVPNALPYQDRYLEIFLEELPADSVWFLVRHHAMGAPAFMRVLERGGHVRVGYEDGPFVSNGQRARSNAELVKDIVEMAESVGRKVVGPERAREIMGLERWT